jgi:hypothetical protein
MEKRLQYATTTIQEKDVEVRGLVCFHIDRHYGEDADGNRGAPALFVDEIINIEVVDEDIELTRQDWDIATEALESAFMEEYYE